MQTFQQFKQEFAQFEQDVLTLQFNQETENRESVRYKIIKYREKATEYGRLLRIYKKQENESVGNEIKNLQDRLQETSIRINEISYIDYRLDRKTLLGNIREVATTLLSCVPLFSFVGLIILFIYLKQNGLEADFFSILLETNGIVFLIIIGIWIGVFHLAIPYWLAITKTEAVINPNVISNILNYKIFFIPVYIFLVLSFSWASYILVSSFLFSVIAAICWCLFSGVFCAIYIQIHKMKNYESKVFMPFLLVLIWYFSFSTSSTIFDAFFKTADVPTVKLELFFSTIGFTQNKYYYFKPNKSFMENIDNNEIAELGKQYPGKQNKQKNFRSKYLYGQMLVDLKDVKILCSIKKENGSRFCHRFSGSDLQRMDWITDEAPKQAEQPAQIPIISKLLRFLSSCKG